MKHLFTILIMLAGFQAYAQQELLFEDGQTKVLIYTYSNVSDESATPIKSALRSIAPANFQSSGFDLRYYRNLKLVKAQSNLNGSIDLTDIQITGAPTLNGFDFGKELTPSEVSFTLVLTSNSTDLFKKDFTLDIDNQKTPGAEIIFTPTDNGQSTDQANYKLEIRQVKFLFTAKTSNAVSTRVTDVNNYATAAQDISDMRVTLAQINSNNPDPEYILHMSNDVARMEKQYELILNAPFQERLKLTAPQYFDPLNLVNNSKLFERELNVKMDVIANQINNIHILFYEKAGLMYQNGNRNAAVDALGKSLKTAPDFPPANLLASQIDFEDGHIDASSQRLSRVINSLNVSPPLRDKAYFLAKAIQQFHLEKGDQALTNKQYSESIQYYYKALDFGNSLTGFRFDESKINRLIGSVYKKDFDERLAKVNLLADRKDYSTALEQLNELTQFKAKFRVNSNTDLTALKANIANDDYYQKIETVKLNARKGDFTAAVTQLDIADRHLRKYRQLITNDLNIENLKSDVFRDHYRALYKQAENLFNSSNYQKAVVIAKEAMQVAQQRNVHTSDIGDAAKLIESIQYKHYLQLIAEGDGYQKEGNNAAAIQKYQEAKNLDSKYLFSAKGKGRDVSSKIFGAAKTDLISELNALMTSRDLNLMETTKAAVVRKAAEFNVNNDSDFRASITRFENSICRLVSSSYYPEAKAEMDRAIINKDYIKALASWTSAKDIQTNYKHCGLSGEALNKLEMQIRSGAQFQEMIAKGKDAESKRQYSSSLNWYTKAGELYTDAGLHSFLDKPRCLDIYDYLKLAHRPGLVFAGIQYFQVREQWDIAFDLLTRSIDLGIHYKRTIPSQKLLGSKMAETHFDPTSKWKTTVLDFVPKERKRTLKVFRRAFKKRWKQID